MPTDTQAGEAASDSHGHGLRAIAVLERDGRQWCATFYRLVPEGAVRAPGDVRGSWSSVRDTVRDVLGMPFR
jgi:hypothetical protein